MLHPVSLPDAAKLPAYLQHLLPTATEVIEAKSSYPGPTACQYLFKGLCNGSQDKLGFSSQQEMFFVMLAQNSNHRLPLPTSLASPVSGVMKQQSFCAVLDVHL